MRHVSIFLFCGFWIGFLGLVSAWNASLSQRGVALPALVLSFVSSGSVAAAAPHSVSHGNGTSGMPFMSSGVIHGDGTIAVTTDSPEFCTRLTRTVDAVIAEPHGIPVVVMEDARHLRRRGAALCRHGHVRAGIERLRRALVLLQQNQDHL